MPLELTQRQQKILNAIVTDFQESAEPVGSRNLSRNYFPDLSPATIRNEMMELEEAGYIIQPYTSAGRVPTDRGYRFYVDRLMKIAHPTVREEEMVQNVFQRYDHDLEEILHQTAKLLSHTLDYSAIVVNLGSHRRLFSTGVSNLLHQPEFQQLENMQKVLTLLEEEEVLTEIVEECTVSREITIRIGSENKHKAAKECSMVVSAYQLDEETIGGIGIVGPTRMYYSKATALVNYIAQELSQVLRSHRT